jgi:hypothetical protein
MEAEGKFKDAAEAYRRSVEMGASSDHLTANWAAFRAHTLESRLPEESGSNSPDVSPPIKLRQPANE